MARRTEKHPERREQPESKLPPSSNEKKRKPTRKPRGGLFHGADPTLAKRVEEELHNLGR